ncbi:TetR/AcrR family transcriptional regulator [Hutsoniella sourekii]|uniref:TetR/AcrR family transcriptional regulator n=1 Tax=Hutsoniella sourekii TaxID=87650 RepID=UPI002286DCAB|nr:TetR/AcrR family transcriptional regulator C-terminal domain-containing protein [Hutsoniella sourekii]
MTQAYRQLMVEKGFDHFIIEDILKQSKVARSTFYRRFHDKYDVMNYYFKRQLQSKPTSYEASLDYYARSVVEYYYIVAKDPDFYHQAMKTTGYHSFKNFIHREFYQWLLAIYRIKYQTDQVPTEDQYAFDFASAGCVQMLERWLADDMQVPMDQITRWELKNAPSHVLRLFDDSISFGHHYLTDQHIQVILEEVKADINQR